MTKGTLELEHVEGQKFADFFCLNQGVFEELFVCYAKEVFASLRDDSMINKAYAVESAKQLIELIFNYREEELIQLATEHGRNWNANGLSIELKLIWFQQLRKLIWDFLQSYNEQAPIPDFFELERSVNYTIDTFIRYHVTSFEQARSEILVAQRELIDELSVTMIPITDSLAILPLVGMIDTRRAKLIQEKSLYAIAKERITDLVIDVSSVAMMDTGVVSHLFKIIDGIAILGCQAVITGIRPVIANTIIQQGIVITDRVKVYGTLQQALKSMNFRRE